MWAYNKKEKKVKMVVIVYEWGYREDWRRI